VNLKKKICRNFLEFFFQTFENKKLKKNNFNPWFQSPEVKGGQGGGVKIIKFLCLIFSV
jgi:hypothetical protein